VFNTTVRWKERFNSSVNNSNNINKTNNHLSPSLTEHKRRPQHMTLWSYGIWIYNYLCNQCLSPLTLWVWTPLRRGVLDTTLCDKVCQLLAEGQWFSPWKSRAWLGTGTQNVAGLNLLMGSQPLDNWISNSNTYIHKWLKTCIDSLPLKKTTF